MSFFNSIINKSKEFDAPFKHWELNEPLTNEAIDEIINADIENPNKYKLEYDGTRAIDGGEGNFREGISSGGKALKFRCFVTKENSKDFPGLAKFIEELRQKKTHQKISNMINKDLSNSYVRVEVICDRKGFWLKPHCDIKEKLLSCLLFVNNQNENENLGTDFYDNNLKKVKTLPYKHNYGYFFSSGPNTWHGMEKKEIVKERRNEYAVDIFVQYGILFAKVPLLSALASLILCSEFPPPVFITKDIFFEFKTSTIWGLPLLTLFIFLHFIPFCLIISQVPCVAASLNPSFINLLAIPTTSCL